MIKIVSQSSPKNIYFSMQLISFSCRYSQTDYWRSMPTLASRGKLSFGEQARD
jgi:hypothetical protein